MSDEECELLEEEEEEEELAAAASPKGEEEEELIPPRRHLLLHLPLLSSTKSTVPLPPSKALFFTGMARLDLFGGGRLHLLFGAGGGGALLLQLVENRVRTRHLRVYALNQRAVCEATLLRLCLAGGGGGGGASGGGGGPVLLERRISLHVPYHSQSLFWELFHAIRVCTQICFSA